MICVGLGLSNEPCIVSLTLILGISFDDWALSYHLDFGLILIA